LNSQKLRRIVAMIAPRAMRLVLAGCMVVLMLGTGHAQSSGAQGVVDHFYTVLLQAMKNGPALGPRGRFQQLEPEIRADFDLASMTRLAVGAAWRHLSSDDRQRLRDAFTRYTTATYAQNFDSWSGEKLEVTGQRDGGFGTIVESRIVKSDGEPVQMDYLMHDNGGKWQIADIYLTGTISQLANLRSQFSAILARDGVGGLIASLNSKADMLVAAAETR